MSNETIPTIYYTITNSKKNVYFVFNIIRYFPIFYKGDSFCVLNGPWSQSLLSSWRRFMPVLF